MSKFCPNCGNELADNAKFCSKCGNNFEDNKKDNKNTINQKGNNDNLMSKFDKYSTGEKVLIIVALCCIGILIIGGLSSIFTPDANTSDSTAETINVSNIQISGDGYGFYDLSCDIVPNEDLSYLEIQTTYYDSNNAVIEKDPLTWNMNDLEAGQTVKASGSSSISGNNKPSRAEVDFYDYDQNLLYSTNVTF